MRLPALMALGLALAACRGSGGGCSSTRNGMVRIPGGTVTIGMRDVRKGAVPPPPPAPTMALPVWESRHSDQALPPRAVEVDPFWIDITEVTRAQYKVFLDETGYRLPFVAEAWAEGEWNWTEAGYPPGTGDHPVVLVDWYDATEYCRWAGKQLPTEAQWQLAALGDAAENRIYPWGNQYDASRLNHGRFEEPNYDESDGYRTTSPVGAFPQGASPYGLLDAFGNAWEFTADFRRGAWSLYRAEGGSARDGEAPLRNPTAPGPGLYVTVRGGAYFFDLSSGVERNAFTTEVRRKTSGFRCVTAGPPPALPAPAAEK